MYNYTLKVGVMVTLEEWRTACDGVVDELLEAAHVAEPPVDVLAITSRLAWPVVFDAGQAGRARLQRLDGRPTLFVRPDNRSERLQWAVAHEIGEATAARVCRLAGASWDEVTPRQREEIANQVAQRLLIPSQWFCEMRSRELFTLKRRFATASHELIAWRWLDLAEPVIVSVFDQGELSRRRCNFAPRAPAICSEEIACATAARESGATNKRTWSAREAVAWPVHEPNWQREILRTTVEWSE